MAVDTVNIKGKIYSAGSIIDKSLFAAKKLDIYDSPTDKNYTGKIIGYVNAGSSCGVVDTYLLPDPAKGRTKFWWVFKPASNYSRAYYIPHDSSNFDLSSLKQQGVITIEEKIEQEKEKEEKENQTWYEKIADSIGKTATNLAIGIGAFLIIREIIKNK